jgi:hypothetical protein
MSSPYLGKIALAATAVHNLHDASRTPPALPPRLPPNRPRLTSESVVPYLDWLLRNQGRMSQQELDANLRAVELVVRIHMGAAQAKDTQHTLVRDGVIDPPPAAS